MSQMEEGVGLLERVAYYKKPTSKKRLVSEREAGGGRGGANRAFTVCLVCIFLDKMIKRTKPYKTWTRAGGRERFQGDYWFSPQYQYDVTSHFSDF